MSVAYPSRWANPHRPAERTAENNARAVEMYRDHLERHPDLLQAARESLMGHDLACWCPPELPSHADVLLTFANSEI